MSADAGKYPMKAVARLTGLNPDTIRAWERRYGAVTPGRSEGSQRLYSDAEVERLRLLRRATEAGHGIGRLARLSEEELRHLLVASAPAPPPASAPPPDGDAVTRILAAVDRYDHLGADRELAHVAALLSPRRVVLEVAYPLLVEVGERWCTGRLSIGQEHLVTSMVRTLLGTLLRLADAVPGRPPIVLATLPGDRHELGALMVALLAATRGVPTCYLGPDTPAAEIGVAARRTRAAAVGISMIRLHDAADAAAALQAIADGLGEGTPLWIGGRAAGQVPPEALPRKARLLPSIEALDAALDGLVRTGSGPAS